MHDASSANAHLGLSEKKHLPIAYRCEVAILVAGASLEAQIEHLARSPDVNMLYGMQA